MATITLVKQRHKHWCALACFESASRDRQTDIWTQERLESSFSRFFPEPDKAMVSLLLPTICFAIGLGNCFHLGKEKEWVLRYRGCFEADTCLIFVGTQKDEKGGVWGHTLRMTAMRDGDFDALNPATGEIEPFKWDFLPTHDCLVYVVRGAELAV